MRLARRRSWRCDVSQPVSCGNGSNCSSDSWINASVSGSTEDVGSVQKQDARIMKKSSRAREALLLSA